MGVASKEPVGLAHLRCGLLQHQNQPPREQQRNAGASGAKL